MTTKEIKFKGPSKLDRELVKRGICTACKHHRDEHTRPTPTAGLRCPNGSSYFTIPLGSVRF